MIGPVFIDDDYNYYGEITSKTKEENSFIISRNSTKTYTFSPAPVFGTVIDIMFEPQYGIHIPTQVHYMAGRYKNYDDDEFKIVYDPSNNSIKFTNSSSEGAYGVYITWYTSIAIKENSEIRVEAADKTKELYPNIPESITINNIDYSITSLEECFMGCNNLAASPLIPATVTDMSWCFRSCNSLMTVTLPQNVTNLDYFYSVNERPPTSEDVTTIIVDCNPLEYRNIFSNVKANIYLGDNADAQLWNEIIEPYSNVYIHNFDDVITDQFNIIVEDYLYSKGAGQDSTFDVQVVDRNKTEYSQIQESLYGVNITNMEGCFQNCHFLNQSIIIPSYVTNMKLCFEDCVALTTPPKIPNLVVNMDGCFASCTNLESAPVIPESVEIMYGCFNGCQNLAGQILCFNKPKLEDPFSQDGYMFDGTIEDIYIIAIGNDNYEIWETVVNKYNNVSFPNSFTFEYGDYTYVGHPSSSRSVVTTNKIKTNYGPIIKTNINEKPVGFMDNCFSDCTFLENPPEIPNSVISMRYCFARCTSLVITPVFENPSSVTDMYSCFSGCNSLTTALQLPDSVINMEHCFNSCGMLENSPQIPSSVVSMEGCFTDCVSLTTTPVFENPSHVNNLNGCFEGCTSLTTILELPESIEYLHSCFYGCGSLTGNASVKCSPSVYNYIFNRACNNTNLYIINNTNPKNESISQVWSQIAATNKNVHFETNDHTAPDITILATRVSKKSDNPPTYKDDSEGTYAKLIVSSSLFEDYIPNGWDAAGSNIVKEIFNQNDLTTPIYQGDNEEIYVDLSQFDDDPLDQFKFLYRVKDKYKTSIATAELTRVLALLDFLGNQNSKSEYIDLPGMGMSIGKAAIRNGLDIHFPTTIGNGLLPPVQFIYEPTKDRVVDRSKTYYELIDNEYIRVDDPDDEELESYYEITGKKVDLSNYQLAIGQFNELNNDAVFIIGNGTRQEPKNIYVVDTDGNSKQEGRAEAKNITDIDEINTIVTRIFEQEEE